MVSSEKTPDEVASDELQQGPNPESGTHAMQKIDDSGIHDLQNKEGITPSVNPEKSLQEPDAGVRISQLDKEGSVLSITPVKGSCTPGPGSHALQFGQEGRTPSMIREKVSEDGYHWRKYGQKFVKGNEFIRSYYRCTHPGCQVKKQLECSHDGKIADVIYLGQHDHPKPQVNVPLAVGFVLSVVEERRDESSLTAEEASQASHPNESTNTPQISTVTSSEDVKGVLADSSRIRDEVDDDDDPRLKRQKKGNRNVDPTSVDKTAGEPRFVIQTLSEVDIVNDGYRWRKYGQKLVKGNPNPRSYYRCSSPGCPVKKHVERASHDQKVVITSYEGQHDHGMPASRNVTPNTTGLNTYAAAIPNNESSTKSGESDILSLDMVAYNGSDSIGKSKEQLDGESKSKSKGSDGTGVDAVIPSSLGHESKSNEVGKGKSSVIEQSDAAALDMVVNTSSISEGTPNEQHNGKSRIESIENGSSCSVHTIAAGLESNPHEQHPPNSERVQN